MMDPRFVQPLSREQLAAIIRQRAARNRADAAAALFAVARGDPPPPLPPPPAHIGGGPGGAPDFAPMAAAAVGGEPRPVPIMAPPPPHMQIPRPPGDPGSPLPAVPPPGPGMMGPGGPLMVLRGPIGVGAAAPPPPPPLAYQIAVRGRHVGGGGPPRHPLYRQASVASSASEDELGSGASLGSEPTRDVPRSVNVSVDGDLISYASSNDDGDPHQALDAASFPGLYIGGKPVPVDRGLAFEVEILDKGSAAASWDGCGISVGVCSKRHPLDFHPGFSSESVAFRIGDRSLFKGNGGMQRGFGPKVEVGDKIGVGVRSVPKQEQVRLGGGAGSGGGNQALVYFTRNGKEFGSTKFQFQASGGYFPIIGLQYPGEEICLKLSNRPSPEEDMMLVDGGEDEWLRLHDIRINGQILEYVGRGKSLVDVGLAQAKSPICTRNHYFEIEIVDPGVNCYIAIGLARKDYPKNRHPGWNKGSIAYHADDGKVFMGSGVGAPFGPRCHKGDIMGCGVLFPRNYQCKSDSEEELEQQSGGGGKKAGELDDGVVPVVIDGDVIDPAGAADEDNLHLEDVISDSEEEWWNDQAVIQSGVKVQIFFTRNSKVIGKKDTRIPRGGFYPTVGMMSCQERVRVDLRPLSG